ncbi:hypothetical protein GE09DRAFT_472515 [Coniochaeta sp. 2T2.1]|nr:hypothetical protein GE09DRAFT_472515 [Coniochaeta sp. 2T2.1]
MTVSKPTGSDPSPATSKSAGLPKQPSTCVATISGLTRACIDKTSSAELSEAINSMFRWYKKAKICIAYLADVSAYRGSSDLEPLRGAVFNSPDLPGVGRGDFTSSRWFTRGWTLQELRPRPNR